MFLALDKLHVQGLRKVIVAVPERSIAASFAPTRLSAYGFPYDWTLDPRYNLCTSASPESKRRQFADFLESDDQVLLCTHATLRFAFNEIETARLNDVLLAIDEFHHVSADSGNQLGEVLREVLAKSTAHVVAMTGSYFRGDSVPVLAPEDEALFRHVTYNYYEQLNGYEHLKSLGIGYHFYQGPYTSAITEILDTDKKTILHIPSPNAGESTKRKHDEVGAILDAIGKVLYTDPETRIMTVERRRDGKLLKVADLVWDEAGDRERVIRYLREMRRPEEMDLINQCPDALHF